MEVFEGVVMLRICIWDFQVEIEFIKVILLLNLEFLILRKVLEIIYDLQVKVWNKSLQRVGLCWNVILICKMCYVMGQFLIVMVGLG